MIETRDVGLHNALFADDPFKHWTPAFMREDGHGKDSRTVCLLYPNVWVEYRPVAGVMPVFGTLPKGNYPFLSLPRPGQRPFVVDRARFVSLMSSIEGREIKWEIVREPRRIQGTETLRLGPEVDKLVVTHRNGKSHGRIAFYNVLARQLHPLLPYGLRLFSKAWKEKERERLKQVPKPKLNKHEQAIAKLQKQLDSVRVRRPDNPCIVEFDGYNEHQRQAFYLWHVNKSARREVMRIARSGLTGAKLYEALYHIKHWNLMYKSATVVKKFSKLNTRQREAYPFFDDYLKDLWKFCHLGEKPWERRPEDVLWGSERYKQWLDVLHRRKELESMIEGLRAEMEVSR